jgi:hypothetical protein
MSTVVYSCGHDENGRYSGGKAGDQSKTEWYGRAWYDNGWTAVYEPPTEAIGKKVAAQAKAGAENDNIGYDQGQRNTVLTQAEKVNWDLAKINVPCEGDCSSTTTVVVICGGGATKKVMMNGSTNCPTTSTIGERLKAAGWKEHKEAKYLNSSDYLGEGWIINNASHHVIVNGTKGAKYKGGSSSANSGTNGGSCPYKEPSTTLKKGSTGTGVSWLQWHLNTLIGKNVISGTKLAVDGVWGSKTEAAFKAFQTKYPETGTNGKPDGKCGAASRKKLKALVA